MFSKTYYHLSCYLLLYFLLLLFPIIIVSYYHVSYYLLHVTVFHIQGQREEGGGGQNTWGPVKHQIKNLADKDDDLLYCSQQAVLTIESWKSYLLRSVQQHKARSDILESLDESSVLITQDWAMKFLPQKCRETQAD